MIYDALCSCYESTACRVLAYIAVYGLVMWLLARMRHYYLSIKLDGPLCLPFVGNYPCMGEVIQSCEDLDRIRNKYVAPVRLWIRSKFALMITEPEDFQEILESENVLYKSSANDPLLKLMDEGVTAGSSRVWKKFRNMVECGFSDQVLISASKSYGAEYAKKLAESMTRDCGTGLLVDFNKYALRFANDVLGDILLQTKFDFIDGQDDEVLELPAKILDLMSADKRSFWKPGFFESSSKQMLAKHRSYFHRRITRKIDAYILAKRTMSDYPNGNGSIHHEKSSTIQQPEDGPFEAMMTTLGSGSLSKKATIDNIDNILIPGADKIATHLSFFIYMMGLYKNIQSIVWNEIFQVYKGDMSAPVTIEDINKMPYLDMCIKEIGRLFPGVVISPRLCLLDMELKNRKISVPSKTTILLNYYSLHRNPEHWDNPNEFRPERFQAGQVAKRHPYAYLPLGSGSRNCIAKHLGDDLVKMAAVQLLRSYEFGSDSKMGVVKIKTDVTVRSVNGYKVFIDKRIVK